METWRAVLGDYEFMLWDAKRFRIESTTWTAQAYKVGLYACAADYIRFYAVYNYGGIYLDTDMEVVKSFDDMLDSDLMLAYENRISNNLEAGCFGAQPNHPFIKSCMDYFERNNLFDPKDSDAILALPKGKRHDFINPIIAPALMKTKLIQYPSQVKIYGRDYFTAKDVVTGVIEQTNNTHTIHHFATQYHTAEWRAERQLYRDIHKVLGEKSKMARLVSSMISADLRIKELGFCGFLHKVWKHFFHRNGRYRNDT
jgi:mannosyltransferase OCH1-like enzyme